jgi:phage baseplate assembly protein W
MSNGKTYGITFPFTDSFNGQYLDLTDYAKEEVRTDLVHLLLTRKGSRYYLPDFGTRLMEFIFDPLDGPTFSAIEAEIRDSVSKYIPNLQITTISITDATQEESTQTVTTAGNVINQGLIIPNQGVVEYTAKVRVDFTVTNDAFGTQDFVIINI